MPAFDYQTRFRRAPVGMVMSRERVVLDVNEEAARIFGHPCGAIIGQSFEMLYPSQGDFERMGARIAPIMNVRGSYSDERITAPCCEFCRRLVTRRCEAMPHCNPGTMRR